MRITNIHLRKVFEGTDESHAMLVQKEIQPISMQTLISILNYYHSHNRGLIRCLIWHGKFNRQSRPFYFLPHSPFKHQPISQIYFLGGHLNLSKCHKKKQNSMMSWDAGIALSMIIAASKI